jgi:hypothetical protein
MNDKDVPATPAEGYSAEPATGEIPAYQPPPPAAAVPTPGPPQWATTRPDTRGRKSMSRTAAVGVTLAFAFGLVVAMALSFTPAASWFGLSRNEADAAPPAAGQTAAGPAVVSGSNLQQGAVFVESNAAGNNQVVAFARSSEGKLKEIGRFDTGGAGSGGVEDASHGLVLGSPEGEVSPMHTGGRPEFLFVPNSGTDTITVFRVLPDRLQKVSVTSSGGEKPVSLTVNHGLLYVLNSGEFDDRFVTGPTSVIENCTTGQLPSVTGFRVSQNGTLTEIPSSTRLLSGQKDSGCAQVSFTPDGKQLLVTERIAGNVNKQTQVAKGLINTFNVRDDGTLAAQQMITPNGNGPFGFTFTKSGNVLVVQQNGGAAAPGAGELESYSLNQDCGFNAAPGSPCAALSAVGAPQPTHGTDSCWIALTTDDKLAFVTSPFGGGTIASYAIGKDGSPHLLYLDASAPDGKDVAHDDTGDGILDVALSHDNKWLYTFDILAGDLYGFTVNPNGSLTLVERRHVFNLPPLEAGGQGGPEGIAVF